MTEVIRGQSSLVYPFEKSALGEHFSGVLEVTLPEIITGVATPDPKGFTILFSTPLKVSASFRGQYTTATFPKPEDTGAYRLEIDIEEHPVKCRQDTGYLGVNQGKHEFSLSAECTFSSIDTVCLGEIPGCTRPFPRTSFNISTVVPTGFGFGAGPSYIVSSSWVVATQSPPDLTLEVVDPNCASPADFECDGAHLEPAGLDAVRLTPNIEVLRHVSSTRTGVVADGVTMLLLRAEIGTGKAAPGESVRFTLKNASGGDAARSGALFTRQGSGGATSIDVPIEQTADNKQFAFALYQAPVDHPAPNALNATNIRLEAALSSKVDNPSGVTLSLLPPPVVLMHGVWSNHLAWANFHRLSLVPAGFRVCRGCRPDYGMSQPAPEFDPLLPESKFVMDTLILAIDAARRQDRKSGIAVTQVDGIGHSMGGIVLRARVAYQGEDYLDNGNYRKGDLHKIITVGSPHRGSSLVTFLIDHRCDNFTRLARADGVAATIEQEFARQGKPMGPAIFGFQTASVALKNIGRTIVPAHAIIGIEPAASDTEDFLNGIPYWTNNKDAQGNYLTIDAIAGGTGTHDTIVPVLSQHGGISLPDAFTRVSGIVHAELGPPGRDVGETESPAVWIRIVELLRAPTAGPAFTAFQAHAPDASDPLRTPTPCPAGKTGGPINVSAAATVLPAPGTTVRAGETIVLTLTASGTNPLQGVLFTIGGRNVVVTGTGPSFTYTYPVPADRAGRLDISGGTYSEAGENHYGETHVNVIPPEPPASIAASPDTAILRRGQQIQIVVTGILPGGAEIDLTSSTAGTTYRTASGGGSIIFVTQDGLVEARGSGTDSIVVTSGGNTATIPVSVSGQLRRRPVRR